MALDVSDLGKPKGSLTLAVETSIGATVQKFTGMILQKSEENYEERIRSRTGALQKSIRPRTDISGSDVAVQIYADDYLDFVDQGVTGVGFGEVDGVSYQGSTMYRTVHNGKFKFKNLHISRGMVDKIEQFWIASAGMSIPAGIDPRQFAIMIAKNIKRRGIKPTKFFTDAINEVSTKELEKELGQVMNREITVELKEVFRRK